MDKHSLRSFQPFTLKHIMIFTYLAIFKKMTSSLMIWSTISSLSRASTGRRWFPVLDLKAYDMSNFFIWKSESSSNHSLHTKLEMMCEFYIQLSIKKDQFLCSILNEMNLLKQWINFFQSSDCEDFTFFCSKTNSYHKG